ncbi:hypothetical protein [uncultured Duncaniella sp.]|uniref:hypothetical protein n=1 Tax=uncultured Duncaniella sp. TaxID=2768039 RepID=UPI0025D89C66|nr:hypothetical protein [uncultured Duncaniella sp.]
MAISISDSIQCVGLPIIVTSSKPHLNFLIYTGASHNVIFSFVYEGLPDYFNLLDSEKSMYGIEGNVVNNRQVKATIEIENTKAETIFSVLEADEVVYRMQQENGFQLHGILGSEFLADNKWIIDYDNLQILT